MESTDDLELLRAFVAGGDADAFAALARRHAGWVFAAARRRLRDDHAAEDAVQVVLTLLTTKAADLSERETRSVSAWLFHATHFACRRIARTRSRRRRHESAAGRLDRGRAEGERWDDATLALLESTIAELPATDREAVVRRFYRREDFATIGRALGVTAEAARKRVARALATCRASMLGDGADVLPDDLLAAADARPRTTTATLNSRTDRRIRTLAKGTQAMIDQTQPVDFPMTSAEFFVADLEANLAFFEKLGFTRRFVDEPDATGLPPRASLRGGAARVWLRRADAGDPATRPSPGVNLYFWMNGGEAAVQRHRDAVAARGVAVNPFFYDKAFVNFTVTSPDGYCIGFFSTYEPQAYEVRAADGPVDR